MVRSLLEPIRRFRKLAMTSKNALIASPIFSNKLTSMESVDMVAGSPGRPNLPCRNHKGKTPQYISVKLDGRKGQYGPPPAVRRSLYVRCDRPAGDSRLRGSRIWQLRDPGQRP